MMSFVIDRNQQLTVQHSKHVHVDPIKSFIALPPTAIYRYSQPVFNTHWKECVATCTLILLLPPWPRWHLKYTASMCSTHTGGQRDVTHTLCCSPSSAPSPPSLGYHTPSAIQMMPSLDHKLCMLHRVARQHSRPARAVSEWRRPVLSHGVLPARNPGSDAASQHGCTVGLRQAGVPGSQHC